MELSINRQGDSAQVKMGGRVDQAGAEELKQGLAGLDLNKISSITVDMSGVTYIGSAGVGKLLLLYKNMTAANPIIKLVNVPREIRELLSDMELGEIFTISS